MTQLWLGSTIHRWNKSYEVAFSKLQHSLIGLYMWVILKNLCGFTHFKQTVGSSQRRCLSMSRSRWVNGLSSGLSFVGSVPLYSFSSHAQQVQIFYFAGRYSILFAFIGVWVPKLQRVSFYSNHFIHRLIALNATSYDVSLLELPRCSLTISEVKSIAKLCMFSTRSLAMLQ